MRIMTTSPRRDRKGTLKLNTLMTLSKWLAREPRVSYEINITKVQDILDTWILRTISCI